MDNQNKQISIDQAIKAIRVGMYCDGYTEAQIEEKADWIYHRALMLTSGEA